MERIDAATGRAQMDRDAKIVGDCRQRCLCNVVDVVTCVVVDGDVASTSAFASLAPSLLQLVG